MSAKRSFWAVVGRILWAIVSFFLRIAARLGSRWARKRLDRYEDKHPTSTVGKLLHRRKAA